MSGAGAKSAVERLARAINRHDVDALAECFHPDYESEYPAHPARNFRGRAQVRKNWSQILARVQGLTAVVVRCADDGDTGWAEWDWSGERADGTPFVMRGVTILGIEGDLIRWVRFYMEPAEEGGPGVDAAVRKNLSASGTA